MKTAMQELIEFYKNNHSFYSYSKDDIIKVLQLFIEKEKEQILNAYQQGHGDAGWTEDKYEPLEYYNQTYNQNK
jgi:hypothetical protein